VEILEKKDRFQKEFAEKLDLIILKYMFDCIRKMNKGQGTILDPGKSKEKKAAFDEREKKVKDQGTQDPVLENALALAEV